MARWSVLPVSILSALCLTLAAPAVRAADTPVQTMTYEVYAGGINAVTAQLDVSTDSTDRYRLALAAWTKGFLAKLAPWSGTFETMGHTLKNGVKMPSLHKSTAIWRGEEEIKEYKYGPDGKFLGLKTTEDGRDVSKEINDELTQGTTDALSATLEVMEAIAASGSCNNESEIFDGDRRFKLIFKHEADEVLTESKYNLFEGPAARCGVEVQPVAGHWHSKPRGWMSIQEQGRIQGSLPTVWLAKLNEDGPAVPVKIRVKTDYGTLFMHLIGYKGGDGAVQKLASAPAAP